MPYSKISGHTEVQKNELERFKLFYTGHYELIFMLPASSLDVEQICHAILNPELQVEGR